MLKERFLFLFLCCSVLLAGQANAPQRKLINKFINQEAQITDADCSQFDEIPEEVKDNLEERVLNRVASLCSEDNIVTQSINENESTKVRSSFDKAKVNASASSSSKPRGSSTSSEEPSRTLETPKDSNDTSIDPIPAQQDIEDSKPTQASVKQPKESRVTQVNPSKSNEAISTTIIESDVSQVRPIKTYKKAPAPKQIQSSSKNVVESTTENPEPIDNGGIEEASTQTYVSKTSASPIVGGEIPGDGNTQFAPRPNNIAVDELIQGEIPGDGNDNEESEEIAIEEKPQGEIPGDGNSEVEQTRFESFIALLNQDGFVLDEKNIEEKYKRGGEVVYCTAHTSNDLNGWYSKDYLIELAKNQESPLANENIYDFADVEDSSCLGHLDSIYSKLSEYVGKPAPEELKPLIGNNNIVSEELVASFKFFIDDIVKNAKKGKEIEGVNVCNYSLGKFDFVNTVLDGVYGSEDVREISYKGCLEAVSEDQRSLQQRSDLVTDTFTNCQSVRQFAVFSVDDGKPHYDFDHKLLVNLLDGVDQKQCSNIMTHEWLRFFPNMSDDEVYDLTNFIHSKEFFGVPENEEPKQDQGCINIIDFNNLDQFVAHICTVIKPMKIETLDNLQSARREYLAQTRAASLKVAKYLQNIQTSLSILPRDRLQAEGIINDKIKDLPTLLGTVGLYSETASKIIWENDTPFLIIAPENFSDGINKPVNTLGIKINLHNGQMQGADLSRPEEMYQIRKRVHPDESDYLTPYDQDILNLLAELNTCG